MPPASRILDMHVCPMVTGIVPHVGGPVTMGAPTVLTGMMPQARVGDLCVCVGPPDVIVKGAFTVLVAGMPAARMGDMTAHGGMLVLGFPTVIIGEGGAGGGGGGAPAGPPPPPPFVPPPVIQIEGPPEFQQKVLKDLEALNNTPSGKLLLDRLQAAGKPIRIVPTADKNGYCAPDGTFGGLKAQVGIGTGSVVMYNPDFSFAAYDAAGNQIATPPQVILGHELCHALANSEGNHEYRTDPNPPASEPHIEEEEAQAIGTGSHSADPPPNENSIRSDLGLPRRDNHLGEVNNPGPEPRNLR